MGLSKILRYIVSHLLNQKQKVKAVLRFFFWQMSVRVYNKSRIIEPIPGFKVLTERGSTAATGNLYCGLQEYEEMTFLLHFLRKGDVFFDVGANIGSYTVLAASLKKAKVMAFEPVPLTFEKLNLNVKLNQLEELVTLHNAAIGSRKSELFFSTDQGTLNHVVNENYANSVRVDVLSLDKIHKETPILIKIDVEGFETEVIKGAANLLFKKQLKAIIIELNGSANRYGYSDKEVHEVLYDAGFSSYGYDPQNRELTPKYPSYNGSVIYVRELAFVEDRLRLADVFTIRGVKL